MQRDDRQKRERPRALPSLVALLATAAAGLLVATGGAASAQAPRAAPIPGALPPGFAYRYADRYRGWPVAPLHAEHPVWAAFLDPRNGGYHFGVDIVVDDAHPDAGAQIGRSHRVYALERGAIAVVRDRPGMPCAERRLSIGHFSYWHVDPTVILHSRVVAGEPIGWTCIGESHVHISEWASYGGKRVWVNPLHRGGKLAPYVDTSPPVVSGLRFETPGGALFHSRTLSGRVDLRARVDDPESFLGWLRREPSLSLRTSPYRLGVTIRDGRGHVVLQRIAFQADQLPQTPFAVHYGRGTVQSLSIQQCLAASCRENEPPFSLRPLSQDRRELWDTAAVPDGRYTVVVSAWDIRGNVGSASIPVVVANRG